MKKYRILSGLTAFLVLLSLCVLPAAALDDPEANCGAAVVVDGDYGDVLYDHNAHARMYPASITTGAGCRCISRSPPPPPPWLCRRAAPPPTPPFRPERS